MTVVAELFAKLGLLPDHESWEKGDRLVEGIKASIEGLISREAVRGLKEMVMGVVDLGSQLNDTAQKTGQSVEGLQFYGFVAKLNSGSAEEMSFAVAHLSRNLAEAAKGTGGAADSLKKLGIAVNGKDFKNADVDTKVRKIAEAMAKLPDGTEKTAIAMGLFGRSGAQLIPTLNDLGKNGDELKSKFEALGGGLTKEQTVALDDFGDEVDMAKFSLGALKNQIVTGMLPALKSMLDSFMAWVTGNKEGIKEAAAAVAEAMGYVLNAAATVGAGIATAVQWLRDHVDIATAIVIAFGSILAIFAIDAAAAWLIAFWPVVLISAAIAAVILALKKLGDYLSGGTRSWSEFFDEVKSQFSKLGDWFLDIPDKIGSAFSSAWEAIKSGAKAAFEWILGLPVIKQVKQLYDYFTKGDAARTAENPYGSTGPGGEKYSGVTDRLTGGSISSISAMQNGGNTPPLEVTMHQQITINPSAGMDETKLGEKVNDHVKDGINEHFQKAFDAFKGGKR